MNDKARNQLSINQYEEVVLPDGYIFEATPWGSSSARVSRTNVFPESGVIETGIVDMGMPSYDTIPGPPLTTADLDARDHFASEVRDLHPTQLDRIEKKLGEVIHQLDPYGKAENDPKTRDELLPGMGIVGATGHSERTRGLPTEVVYRSSGGFLAYYKLDRIES